MDEMPEQPIQLRTPSIILPEAQAIMERHGCVVEEGQVTLPMGSVRTELLWIRVICLWYDILLPDQYQMIEAYDWERNVSILYLQPEKLESIQGKKG